MDALILSFLLVSLFSLSCSHSLVKFMGCASCVREHLVCPIPPSYFIVNVLHAIPLKQTSSVDFDIWNIDFSHFVLFILSSFWCTVHNWIYRQFSFYRFRAIQESTRKHPHWMSGWHVIAFQNENFTFSSTKSIIIWC